MIEDLRYNSNNNQISLNGANKNQQSNVRQSFKGNPNAVDKTPTADTYQPHLSPVPDEEKPESPLTKAAYLLPTWYALNKGTQLFDKACGGEYEKSLVGRLGSFGDRISDTKLVKNGFVDSLKTHTSSIKKNIQNYVDKHPMLSAMDKTPTKPENGMAKTFMETQSEYDAKEAFGKIDELIKDGPKSLKEAGATKDEINALKQKFGTNLFGGLKNKEAALQEYQLTKLGDANILTRISSREAALDKQLVKLQNQLKALPKGDAMKDVLKARIDSVKSLKAGYRENILNSLKLEKLGLNRASFEALKVEPGANPALVEKVLEKGKEFFPKLSEHYNKLKVMHAPKTALGKFLPKMAKVGMRGLTFGGGLFNTLFIAWTLSDSIKNTVNAPKDQKVGTAAAGLLETLSWVASMPLALGAMHKIGGLQYTGLSKAQVEAFRTAKKAFDAKAKAGAFADEAAYKAGRDAVEALKKVPNQSKLTKAVKGFAKFIGIGLEQYTPFRQSTKGLKFSEKLPIMLKNLGKKLPNFGRNCLGYPLRFGLYMFVFAAAVDKLFSGVTSAIFGKPYDPEEIKEQKAKEAEHLAQLYPGPRMLPNQQAEMAVGTTDLNQLSDANLIKQKVKTLNPSQLGGNGQTPVPVQQPNQPQVNGQYQQPFMPPVSPDVNNGNNNGTNPAVPNTQNDPNISQYDTVPRNYVPQIDFNNPVKFSDPMTNPNAERNYDSAQKLADKSDKLADSVEAFLNEKS